MTRVTLFVITQVPLHHLTTDKMILVAHQMTGLLVRTEIHIHEEVDQIPIGRTNPQVRILAETKENHVHDSGHHVVIP